MKCKFHKQALCIDRRFKSVYVLIFSIAAMNGHAQPKPSSQQQAWHDMEFYLFMHFGPNTFTNLEWGKGTEKEEIFDPVNLDCNQWCRIARAAGAKGIIITAKHHDGFCLWPSKFSTHTVRESKWRKGHGDVLKELSTSCKKYGLSFGVYLSPWDRNHPQYGTPGYNDVFVNMLKEIFTNYGPIWELWWDGANGEGPGEKKQVYDFRRFENEVRKISPNTVIFSDIGPDIRWCGNEAGMAGTTNWNTLDTAGFTRGAGSPPQDTLNTGNINGRYWIPAECDVSIRPGWFYHNKEDDKVKTPAQLFDLYLKSVGRGANLLLNVPPDGNGLITAYDSTALTGFYSLRKKAFANDLSKRGKGYVIPHNDIRPTPALNDANDKTVEKILVPGTGSMGIDFRVPRWVNCVVVKESLVEGQHCRSFVLLLMNDKHQLIKRILGTTIGRKRIIIFPEERVRYVGLAILEQKGITSINGIETYLLDKKLIKE